MNKTYSPDKDSTSAVTPLRVGRGIINSVVLLSTAFLLLLVSFIAFFLFYHYNVPAIGVEKTAHLQYHTGLSPHATIDLEFSAAQLAISQPYDIIVELVLPNSPTNHAIGNFMVSIDLFSSDETSLIKSARPAIMTYHSPLIATLSTVLTSGPILVGMRDESQTLRVPVLEDYQFSSGWLSDPSHARIELSSPALRVYRARVLFRTRLGGLPWCLHTFRLTSFVIFTTLFWLSSVAAMTVAYAVVSLSPRPGPRRDGRDEIKKEADPSEREWKDGPSSQSQDRDGRDDRLDRDSASRGTGSSVSSAQFFQFEPPTSQRRSSVSSEATIDIKMEEE